MIDPAGVDFFRTAYHGSKKVVVAELIVDEEKRRERMLIRGDGHCAVEQRIQLDAKIFPIKDADLYLTNVDSTRTADALYQYLIEQE